MRPNTFLRGGRRYITPHSLADFFAAVTRAANGDCDEQTSPHNLTQPEHKSLADVERELDGEGL